MARRSLILQVLVVFFCFGFLVTMFLSLGGNSSDAFYSRHFDRSLTVGSYVSAEELTSAFFRYQFPLGHLIPLYYFVACQIAPDVYFGAVAILSTRSDLLPEIDPIRIYQSGQRTWNSYLFGYSGSLSVLKPDVDFPFDDVVFVDYPSTSFLSEYGDHFFVQSFASPDVLFVPVFDALNSSSANYTVYQNRPKYTFNVLLDTLKNAPRNTSIVDFARGIYNETFWGFLNSWHPATGLGDFLKGALEAFRDVGNFILWIIQDAVDVVSYLIYFVRLLI